MEIHTVLELLGLAFVFGAGWNSLRMQIGRLNDSVTFIRKNHLVHIQEKLDSLPCDVIEERVARLEREA